MYCFENFAVCRVFGLGQCTVSEEEIVAFGTCYDPQPFHADGVAAAESIYGGLIASGVHTMTPYIWLFVDGLLSDSASLESPSIDELRWPTPIHPGDTLRARYTVTSSRESRSHPEWGIMQGLAIGENQDGVSVITMSVTNFFTRRVSAGASEALRSGVPGASM